MSNNDQFSRSDDPSDQEPVAREIERALANDAPNDASEIPAPIDPRLKWWDSLPRVTQKQLAARAEDYATEGDFFYGYLGHDVVDFGIFGSGAREWINKNLDGVFLDDKMGSDPDYAKGRIKNFLRITEGYLNRTFSVPVEAHRPVENRERDSTWSKLEYQGFSYAEIAERQLTPTGGFGADEIATAVRRHRKRRRELTLFIAHGIWTREYQNDISHPTSGI